MDLERLRLTRAGVLGVAVTIVLAGGGTAAYSLAGRRSPAAAHDPLGPAQAPVSLRVSAQPAQVVHGSKVTVAGVLADQWGAPLPGRSVEVVTAPTDATNRRAADRVKVLGTPMSDGRGTVSLAFRPTRATVVWLRFAGAVGLSDATSDPITVSVAQRVSVVARTAKVPGGWRTTFRGAVRPGRAGEIVRLERRVGRSWRSVARARLTQASTYAFTPRRLPAGTFTYRVVRPADGGYLQGTATYRLRLAAPRPRPAAGNGGPARLLVSGDSFAYFLGHQLAGARAPRVTTVESRPSTGLARPDFFDWNAFAREQVATLKPGAVVVFLGANDCQPIRVGGTGRWAVVGSAAWATEYRRRAGELIRTYAGNGARPVYWVGLPIVAKPDITACYRAMNGATKAATRDVRGATWIDSWALYAVNGRFSPYVRGVLARQEDGIHLTYEGTRFLTRTVYGTLRP